MSETEWDEGHSQPRKETVQRIKGEKERERMGMGGVGEKGRGGKGKKNRS